MSAGKGDKQRPGKPGAYARGYEAIDWSKGRCGVSRTSKPGALEFTDFTTPVTWVVPTLEEILGKQKGTK